MSDLHIRWTTQSLFMEIFERLLTPPIEQRDDTFAWWSKVPRTTHYAYESEEIDLRGIDLNGRDLTSISLSWSCLDDLQGRDALYKETGFQSSTARQADFSGSEFDHAQMSPFYARGASFKDCEMYVCVMAGIGPRFDPGNPNEPIKGNYSDLRDCDFGNVVATRCHFDRCDFRGARFTNAKFVDCRFDAADLTEVDFEGVSFEGCDFSWTELPDRQEVRALISRGSNRATETIHWR